MMAPVDGSGSCPAWMQSVANPMGPPRSLSSADRVISSSFMSDIRRRDFMGVAAATAATLVAPSVVGAAVETPKVPAAGDAPKWLNEPKQWKRDGESLLVTADAKTDFWRKTFFPYITDNGHF